MGKNWPEPLLSITAYPHHVDELQLIETHISWVVLTGPFAYKIKKPVSLEFLDFSTLELRRHYCYRELELNRRFSRNLYLDVVPITGTWEKPAINGDGDIIDYAVKMRQFDNRQLADNLAKNGRLSDELIKGMAKTLARIHNELPAVSNESEFGAVADFYAAAMQNFTQINTYALSEDIQQSLSTLEQWTISTYQRCQPQLEQRRREGFVKDCHGDCHLGNIVVIDDKVTLFDCIEFNDKFRIQDTIAEAAFLSMDLCAHDLYEQSQRFLNTYLEYRDDYHALPLFDLFRCYYALVRAKVNLLAKPATDEVAITIETHRKFYRYIALAQNFMAVNAPVLILMHGLSGSGKSYLAERIAAHINAIRIRSDVERKRLFNLNIEQTESDEDVLYHEDATRRTFARLLALTQSIMTSVFSCVVDATFLTHAARKPFIGWAIQGNIPLVILNCEANEEVILRRLQQRSVEGSDPSDADCEVYKKQKSAAEALSAEEKLYQITIDTERTDCIEYAISQLSRHFNK